MQVTEMLNTSQNSVFCNVDKNHGLVWFYITYFVSYVCDNKNPQSTLCMFIKRKKMNHHKVKVNEAPCRLSKYSTFMVLLVTVVIPSSWYNDNTLPVLWRLRHTVKNIFLQTSVMSDFILYCSQWLLCVILHPLNLWVSFFNLLFDRVPVEV